MGKWAFKILAELFLKNEKALDDRTFFTQCVRYHRPGVKRFHQKAIRVAKKQFIYYSQIFNFRENTIIRPLTPTFGAGQSSIASPILIF